MLILPVCTAFASQVVEPAGSLPVAHEVDVVVVGGSSGGVAAAVAAAQRGAKVFLAAPRPYLGEDLCATYRLWLEPGEQPATDLAREVFKASAPSSTALGPGLPFKYSADKPSSSVHRDTQPGSLLNDGKWHGAPNQSVQYDGDVTLQLDLGREQDIARVSVLAYQRNADFEVEQVTVSASADDKTWTPLGNLKNDQLGQGQFENTALTISASLAAKCRYLRLVVKKGPEARRVLLGEVVVEGNTPSPAPPAEPASPRSITPMQVKRVLDQALIAAKVPFLYGCFATDLLRDAQGKPAGIVMANRSGRQAIIAKVIIDATERAHVARLAGARFTDWPAGTAHFTRVVVGGAARQGAGSRLRQRPAPMNIVDRKGDAFPVFEYELQIPLRDARFASFAEAEQLARDWTWTRDSVDASETLFAVPLDSFRGATTHAGSWPGPAQLPLACLQPAGTERLFALGGCADLSREAAAQLVRPVNLTAIGARVGEAAAQLAAQLPRPAGVRVEASRTTQVASGEVRELSPAMNHRHVGAPTVPTEAQGLPVWGEYDVVVVGGGTGGAPAGIAAGRHGAKTLLIEYLHALGGVGTAGLISSYYHGNRVGFTHEVDQGLVTIGPKDTRTVSANWAPDWKTEWYRRELRKAGVEIWYGVLGTGAVVENQRVKGVVVATPQGRCVVLAKTVIDSTGNADIAAAAGATCRYTDETDVAVQGTGLPPKELGTRYTNTDYTFVDDTDVFDLWRVLVIAKQKFKAAYDLGQLIDTRERRQIVGDMTLSPMDMMLGRTHPDTVVIARSNFDTHGYIIHPLFLLRPPHRADIDVRVPWRCLLPRGLDGLIVTGLGVSAHRDALPCIRMQPDVQNQGYAAGVAAAMIVKKGCATRELDIRALQRHLVEIGNLPSSVLAEKDSFPLSRETIAEAVGRVANEYDGLETVLADPEAARPLLSRAMNGVHSEKAKVIYAHILAMLGDGEGVDALIRVVQSSPWDKGWRYTGMGQFGASMSPLDSYLVALGRTKSPLTLKPILDKVSQLTTNSEFSHFRAVALALESLGDPSAARPLADLLQTPGISGHAVTSIEAALRDNPASGTDTSTRNRALTELYLARALYRCGDHQGVGEKILRQYAQDLHGHYARHAQAVLKRERMTLPKNPT